MKEEIIDKKSAVKECEMCHEPIIDKYYLNVGDLMTVHEKCLKCASCSRLLEQKKCFYKDRKFYCADCCRSYNCHKCHRSIGQNEYFIRLNHKLLYHTDCFRCSMCLCRIDPGSPYALLDDNILCENHYCKTLKISIRFIICYNIRHFYSSIRNLTHKAYSISAHILIDLDQLYKNQS